MSTKANIRIKDKDKSVLFYRHHNGYPEATMPTLEKFLNLVKEEKIQNNVYQASGWLLILGQPADVISDDIEYLYEVDLTEGKIIVQKIEYNHEKNTRSFKVIS